MAVLDNAGIAGEFKEFQFRGHSRGSNQHHGQDMHDTHNHFNLIPAEEGEVTPGEEEEEDIDVQLPGLEMEEGSSDNETYVDEEIED